LLIKLNAGKVAYDVAYKSLAVAGTSTLKYLDPSVMLPDSQRTSQQTRSFGLAAKPKTVPDLILIGNALVVDLPLPGSIRSAGTQEYQ